MLFFVAGEVPDGPGNVGAVPGLRRVHMQLGQKEHWARVSAPEASSSFFPLFLFGGWGPLRINQQRRVPVFSS